MVRPVGQGPERRQIGRSETKKEWSRGITMVIWELEKKSLFHLIPVREYLLWMGH